MTILACIIHSFHAWFWCLSIFSWSAYFLNVPSKKLAYLIVHMPLTFAGLKLAGNLGLKNFSAVIVATLFVTLTCWLFFELVRRTRITRFMFGIKESRLSIEEK